MMTVFALAVLGLSVWVNDALHWWWVALAVFLALLDLGTRVVEAKARKPYMSFEEVDGVESPLHWMLDAMIDLSVDLRRVLNDIEEDIEA